MIFRRDSSIEYSKKGQRQISLFMAKELLFDYSTGQLDPERTAALDAHLKVNAELRVELDNIKYGRTYAEQLKAVRPNAILLKRMKSPVTFLGLLKDKLHFDKWPITLRWFVEALVIGGAVTMIVTLIPWHQLLSSVERRVDEAIVIAELSRPTSPTETPTEEAASPVETPAIYAKEEKSDLSGEKPKAPEVQEPPAKEVIAATETPKTPPVVNEPPAVTPAETTAPVAAATSPTVQSGRTQGYLYRGTLYVTNLDPTTEKLVAKIAELGGRKAGNVSLGWKKDNERYFHFTLPSAQIEALAESLKVYGDIKLSKERHERIMPEGIARYIISVYEKPAGNGP